MEDRMGLDTMGGDEMGGVGMAGLDGEWSLVATDLLLISSTARRKD
jgi:hypothetical protein